MKDTMSIILAGTEFIPPITDKRSGPSLPIAGRYRIIDFMLSNLVNAGISNIGVATTEKYSSLMDHIKSGSPWDLNRKKQGLNILPPNLNSASYHASAGDIDILAGIRDFIRKSHQTYVILTHACSVFNIDFDKVMEEHIKNQADITIVYKNMQGASEKELSRFVLLDVNEEKRVVDIESKPYYPKTANAGMDIYIMEKALLESIIDECSARGTHDFVKDALAQKLDGLRVFGYQFDGYFGKVDSLKSYYQNNMAFLEAKTRAEIFNPIRPVFTKTKDHPPAKYGNDTVIENSFIADGCVIEGTVINCVLSRGVKIKKGAVVKNSIIMQDSIIDEAVELDYVIFDKEVHITRGRKLLGQKSYPLAIAKGTEI